ncbi:neogenin-like isoform X1 [Eriocheir sinensis]|uniref:neogenin-like isoform X1 n=1 Tax=Eriocheir sinensis TaxID=95602 RepID=UPI0021C64BF8|nr:neogenin-like isoform X1 [Eriocheir sinensis]
MRHREIMTHRPGGLQHPAGGPAVLALPGQPSTTTFTRQPSTTTFTRQPLQRNNGRITGYVIFLTTDQTVGDWVMGEVTGDWLTLTVHGLTPSRKYLHKMHSHNVKGFGPFSSVESFTTSSVGGSCSESNKPGVQPPDLWIHHGHLELKNFDKGERSNSPNHASIIQHTGLPEP